MEQEELKSGMKIPVLGLGTWGVGGRFSRDSSGDQKSIENIQKALDMGYTHIDTAEMYGAGHSEELVGEAIKDYNREDLFITTKVSPSHLRHDDLIQAARNSLERLGLNYVDLYLIHKPNFDVPISETMQAMDELVEEGLIKSIGVSNFSVSQLKMAQADSENPIVTNQIEYNLLTQNSGEFNRKIKDKIVPYCQHHDIIVTAFRPLAKGKLAQNNYEIVNEMAEKYSKAPAQIALNWLISQEKVITIPKALSPKHLEDNLGATGWRLSEEDRQKLGKTFQD